MGKHLQVNGATTTGNVLIFDASGFALDSGVNIGEIVDFVTLQTAYNNGGLIITNTTNGSIKFRRGSALDTDNVLEIQNGAGAIRFSVNGNGDTNISGPLTAVLTNCTGLPIGTGVSGLGAGIATFLATPTSANLAAAVTNETGTGLLVFNSSPTFATAVIGGATMAVFNTASTTVNAFGAATTLNIGGTPTTAVTHNYSANATATGVTKTINIGTGGASGSTTAVTIGSAVSGAINNIRVNLVPGSDATGDTYYRNSSGFLTRIGIGPIGNVFTVSPSGLPSWASGAGAAISTLFTASTTASVTNTATEGTLMGTGVGSKTIGANTMAVGSMYRITVSGSIVAAAGQTMTIRVKFGSTTILTTSPNNLGSITGTRMIRITADITVRSIGAGGTVIGSGALSFSTTSSIVGVVWEIEASGGNGTTSSIDTTVAQVVDVTAQWGAANVANSISGYNVSIEKLN